MPYLTGAESFIPDDRKEKRRQEKDIDHRNEESNNF